jgi:type IV pilus assembly protein PilV
MKQIKSGSRGFTLVEVMVALVVLSVGLLGIAGLYVVTLRSGSGAIYRMQAVNLASDLADRIRANRRANVLYAGGAANNNCYTAAANCSAAQMAANDLLVWRAQVAAILPQGASAVTVNGAGYPYTYTINVNWLESGGQAVNDRMSYTLIFQL